MIDETTAEHLNALAAEIHTYNLNWWVDIKSTCKFCQGNTTEYPYAGSFRTCRHCLGTGYPLLERNVGEMLMLAVSELAEAMEGHRKNLQDDHLPDRSMLEVELADCVIRIMDLSAGLGLDLGGALVAKIVYNLQRADHKVGARLETGGKAY